MSAVGLLLHTPLARARRAAGLLPGVPAAPSWLAGRRVLVTGASSGIGEATAYAAARRGATVLLVARRADELDRVRAAIVADGGRAHAYVCDLTDAAALDRLVAQVLAEHGGVDGLVNNAGRSIRRSLAASWDRVHDVERTLDLNFVAPVRLTLGLLPGMVERGEGRVVNVLTWGVQVKAPKFSAYIASKTALDAWSRIAGRELYGDGVSFSNVRLSLVRTPMIGPTDVYRRAPALSPERAGEMVVRALEERPVTVDTLAGRVAEVLNLALPRFSDLVAWAGSRGFPDSPAAVRHLEEPAEEPAEAPSEARA
ncbi:SDR family NAD(P)-dependent oxidoreductase [Nocardioides sp. HDW12B]|uniref:SDR family NAD(P)-dependent oxidoreductase n=1 Tax=Nocardioides sp. HDW12B TaxID=2714939 RepID=UPI001F10CE06|nr:SDR family NAD(P)-dependent oxidoreductase [Nocardioides sp. HDW12B]